MDDFSKYVPPTTLTDPSTRWDHADEEKCLKKGILIWALIGTAVLCHLAAGIVVFVSWLVGV